MKNKYTRRSMNSIMEEEKKSEVKSTPTIFSSAVNVINSISKSVGQWFPWNNKEHEKHTDVESTDSTSIEDTVERNKVIPGNNAVDAFELVRMHEPLQVELENKLVIAVDEENRIVRFELVDISAKITKGDQRLTLPPSIKL